MKVAAGDRVVEVTRAAGERGTPAPSAAAPAEPASGHEVKQKSEFFG